jgi:hypothetical protein
MARISSAFPGGFDHVPLKHSTLVERVTSLEGTVAAMQQTLDVQFKRIAAMQAAIDHLTISGKHNDNS